MACREPILTSWNPLFIWLRQLDNLRRAVLLVILARFSGRLIATFLFGVDPLDPLTFASVPFVILHTAIVAAAAPAWRASRINPIEAFRHDG